MLVRLSNFLKRTFSSDEIFFEGRLNFEVQPSDFIEKFEKFFSKNKQKQSTALTINLEKVDFIYPSTLIFLTGLLDILKEQNTDLQLRITEKSKVHEYMEYCGFSDIFGVPKLPENFESSLPRSGLLPLEKSDQLKDTESKASWFVGKFDALKDNNKFISTAKDATDEILRNIQQHSKYLEYLLLGQYYPNSKNVRLCVRDNGIGIKRHLTMKSYSEHHSAFKKMVSKSDYSEISRKPANFAIEKAATYFVSATKYEENSGAGIDFIIKDFSVPYSGTVTIVSQDGLVQWKEGEKKVSIGLPFELKGTMVSITAKT